MMLMRNAPVAVHLAQTHSQPEQETVFVRRIARRVGTAAHDCRREGDVLPRGYRELLDVEGRSRPVIAEEQVPGLFVGLDPLWLRNHVRRPPRSKWREFRLKRGARFKPTVAIDVICETIRWNSIGLTRGSSLVTLRSFSGTGGRYRPSEFKVTAAAFNSLAASRRSCLARAA